MIITPPITKNTKLNVEKLSGSNPRGFLSASVRVVAPIATGYNEPIIMPMMKNTVALLHFSRAVRINLTIETMPIITPIPNVNKIGIYCRFRCSVSLIALIIGIYNPNTSRSVEPDMPGSTIAQMAIAPAMNT